MTLEVQGVVLLGGILAIMRFLSCASGSGGANVILVDTCRLGVAWRATRPSFAGTRARHPPWSTPAMARASATAPAAEARSAWRPAGCGRRRFGRVIMVGSHPVVVRMAPLAGGSAEPPAEGIHKDTDGPDQASECVQQFAHLPGRRLAPADFGMSASRLGEGPTSMPRGLPEQSNREHRAVPRCRGKDQRGSFSLGRSGGVTRPSRLMKRAGGSGCACSSSSRRASADALPATRFEGTNFSAVELTVIFSPA